MEIKNAVVYARFSSHAQNEQSIEGQLAECKAFAERNGYKIIAEYIDRAISGKTDNRPEFLRMVEDSKRKHFQFVIVYQLDRFARNRYDSATYKARLKKNGVRVLSAKENITDDASGVLIEGVLESMAEYYSLELSQKVKRGISISASKNQFFGGALPFGYDIDENKHYQINRTEAPFVIKIYELYAEGKTEADICRYLNEQKVQTKTGNRWNKSSLKRILSNKRYIGYYLFQDKETEGGVPQIVDGDLFAQVQQQLERNKKARSARKADEIYILTTKLFCGLCEHSMNGMSGTSRTGEKHYYYRCFTKDGCRKLTVQKSVIEDAVIADILEFLTEENIERIALALQEMLRAENERGNLLRLERVLSDNKKAVENILTAVAAGKGVDLLLEKLERLQTEQKEIQEQILIEKSGLLDGTLQQLKRYVREFKHKDYSDINNRQALVETFVQKVWLLDGGKKAKIRYNVTDFRNGQNVGSFYDRVVDCA